MCEEGSCAGDMEEMDAEANAGTEAHCGLQNDGNRRCH